MKRLLVAITYHSIDKATVNKTLRSTKPVHVPEGWGVDTIGFYYDRAPKLPGKWVKTNQETLGGKRNYAIEWAQTQDYELISFLDDDDLFGPSWIPGLITTYEADVATEKADIIYHPQWIVLFDKQTYRVSEQVGSADPRFDSRDMIFYNPWSAEAAFNPWAIKTQYYEHKKSDPKYSFEDWSFNFDTYCAGIEHVGIKDTFHFVRQRQASLGKATIHCVPEHKQYYDFLGDYGFRKIYTEEAFEPHRAIDGEKLAREMAAIHQIEPQIWFWKFPDRHIPRQPEDQPPGVKQEIRMRVGKTIDKLAPFANELHFASDVFVTFDHNRTGGAEKALKWCADFLNRHPGKQNKAAVPPLWIDDVAADGESPTAYKYWSQGLQNLLHIWSKKQHARSLHICNSGPAWDAVLRNPALFEDVKVYWYIFNDDVMFPPGTMSRAEMGYHSPLYAYADYLDHQNFYYVTDNQRFAGRIAEILGPSDRIRVVDIPCDLMPNKRKEKPDGAIDILWASRLAHLKGVEDVLALIKDPDFNSKKYRLHVYGDGDHAAEDAFKQAHSAGIIEYGGGYESFDKIAGKYDFFLFTSEREGNPNVVKEAIRSGLPVLARDGDWLNGETAHVHIWRPTHRSLVQAIVDMAVCVQTTDVVVNSNAYSAAASEPSMLKAYKEIL